MTEDRQDCHIAVGTVILDGVIQNRHSSPWLVGVSLASDGSCDGSHCDGCQKNGPFKGHPHPHRRIWLLYRCIKVLPIDIDLYDPVPPLKADGIDLDLNLFPYINIVTFSH